MACVVAACVCACVRVCVVVFALFVFPFFDMCKDVSFPVLSNDPCAMLTIFSTSTCRCILRYSFN